MSKTRVIQIGIVGVDSAQLVICDPSYIESQFKMDPENESSDFGHDIYQHKNDKSLWQFTYGKKPAMDNVNPFPGSYINTIPQYNANPNDLIERGIFVKTDIDPRSHIPDGEFSYRGICKANKNSEGGGQLNYALGHPGVAVATSTGYGDGSYPVFAEINEQGRTMKVWVDFSILDYGDGKQISAHERMEQLLNSKQQ